MLLSSVLITSRLVFYSAIVVGCYLAFSPGGNGLHSYFNDKLMHAVGFFVMTVLAHLAHPQTWRKWPVFGLIAFGLAIELVQGYLPYRSFSMWDWTADIFGILLYLLVAQRPVSAILAKYKYGLG
jgi:VanZ family protein